MRIGLGSQPGHASETISEGFIFNEMEWAGTIVSVVDLLNILNTHRLSTAPVLKTRTITHASNSRGIKTGRSLGVPGRLRLQNR